MTPYRAARQDVVQIAEGPELPTVRPRDRDVALLPWGLAGVAAVSSVIAAWLLHLGNLDLRAILVPIVLAGMGYALGEQLALAAHRRRHAPARGVPTTVRVAGDRLHVDSHRGTQSVPLDEVRLVNYLERVGSGMVASDVYGVAMVIPGVGNVVCKMALPIPPSQEFVTQPDFVVDPRTFERLTSLVAPHVRVALDTPAPPADEVEVAEPELADEAGTPEARAKKRS